MKPIRMIWQRHGSLSRKLIRKVFALVVLLIGMRLVWVSFYNWNATTIIEEDIVESNGNTHIKDLKSPIRDSFKDTETDSEQSKYLPIPTKHEFVELPVKVKTDSGSQDEKLTYSKPEYKEQALNDNKNDTRGTNREAKVKPVEAKETINMEIDNKALRKPFTNNTLNTPGKISNDKIQKTPRNNQTVETIKSHGKIKTLKSEVNTDIQKESSETNIGAKDKNLQDNSVEKPKIFNTEVEAGTCKMVNVWNEEAHTRTSTFDLFENVDYSMNAEGEYPIPARTFEEITKSRSNKSLSVILVPFSHADPGYGLTIEQYYAQMTHSSLNNMIKKLHQYPNMTFQWAETVFLARWFEDLEENDKQAVRNLIQRGQFEVVLGGWVMPDEASPNYIAVVDQLIEGHQWLIENLGVKPTSAWVNDPFGYSSTMPYLWKSSGLDNLVFLRINQPVKAKLMKMKSLDFMWRPYWKDTKEMDLLSSLMSYTNYWMGDVCGPDPKICQQFNFLHLGSGNSQGIPVTDSNVAERARVLYEQFLITGDLYKYNTLYIGLGEDFSYPQPQQWDDVYLNYEKLINYINSQSDWNMKVKFGTLKEYFHEVRKEEQEMVMNKETDANFPILSGDFFPYTERKKEFWTGYFTTRPLNKIFSREMESLIRAADIFNVVAYSSFKYYKVKYQPYENIAKSLRYARRELGMFMHHDGITGTSLPHVVSDYEQRLFQANEEAHAAFKMIILSMLTKGKLQDPKLLQAVSLKPGSKIMSGNLVINATKEHSVVLVNPLSKKRKEIVTLRVSSKNIVVLSSVNANTPIQMVNRKGGEGVQVPYTVAFEVTIPPFGIEVYKMSPASRTNSMVEVFEGEKEKIDDKLFIENMHLKVEFDKKSGVMRKIIDKNGRMTNITAQFMVYKSKTSGAYIFGPSAPASAFRIGESVVKVTKGPLMSEVKVTSQGFSISVILYNTTAIQGHGIHIKTDVDMKEAGMSEMEVILRLKSDVKNGGKFYTDQNGFQLIGRQNRPRDPIESNYYPITTMAILEDDIKRLTLHCRQPHGGASLNKGQLEVMLDRHTFRDDGRGLGQGVYDNVRIKSEFIVQTEYKEERFQPIEKRYTYASEDSMLMNDMLQNGVIKYVSSDSSVKLSKHLYPLKTEFPCDVSIVGFRNLVKNNLEYNGTSLVLHRKPIHCGYKPVNGQCKKIDTITVKSLFPKLKVKISETSLSHLYNKTQLTTDSDLRPDYMELRAFRVGL